MDGVLRKASEEAEAMQIAFMNLEEDRMLDILHLALQGTARGDSEAKNLNLRALNDLGRQ